MNKESFIKGLALLEEAFNRNFNRSIYWESLLDLDDQSFRSAVVEIIKTQKELYPNTNLIAIVREKAQAIHKRTLEQRTVIADMRSDPPPPEWDELKKKIGGGT